MGKEDPTCLLAKNQNIKQKQCCNKFNKNFKNGLHQKLFKKDHHRREVTEQGTSVYTLTKYYSQSGKENLPKDTDGFILEKSMDFEQPRTNPHYRGWRRKWQPTPILLPGKSHGQRSLVSMGSQRVGHNRATKHSTAETEWGWDSALWCQKFI